MCAGKPYPVRSSRSRGSAGYLTGGSARHLTGGSARRLTGGSAGRLSGGSAGRLSGGSAGRLRECLSVSTICTLQQLSVIPCSPSQPITTHRPERSPSPLTSPPSLIPLSHIPGALTAPSTSNSPCVRLCVSPPWSYLINFCSEETLKGEREGEEREKNS